MGQYLCRVYSKDLLVPSIAVSSLTLQLILQQLLSFWVTVWSKFNTVKIACFWWATWINVHQSSTKRKATNYDYFDMCYVAVHLLWACLFSCGCSGLVLDFDKVSLSRATALQLGCFLFLNALIPLTEGARRSWTVIMLLCIHSQGAVWCDTCVGWVFRFQSCLVARARGPSGVGLE